MLEKNDFFCDSHFHLIDLLNYSDLNEIFDFLKDELFFGCVCAHNQQKFLHQDFIIKQIKNVQLIQSFGLHPQNPVLQNADFLENLLKQNKIQAIGESGFDFFNEEFKNNIENQKKAWNIQLDLAIKYQKTLIIHCRKALDLIFADSKRLKNVPAVLFHSFCGGIHQANGILNKGINAYFSFGKQILNNNKKSIECTSILPLNKLLLETDAPFQTLKNENFTKLSSIIDIYNQAFLLRNKNSKTELQKTEFKNQLLTNFKSCFYI